MCDCRSSNDPLSGFLQIWHFLGTFSGAACSGDGCLGAGASERDSDNKLRPSSDVLLTIMDRRDDCVFLKSNSVEVFSILIYPAQLNSCSSCSLTDLESSLLLQNWQIFTIKLYFSHILH